MPKQVWSDAERRFIADNAGRLKDAEVAAALFRITGRKVSVYGVRFQRYLLGIKKRRGRGLCQVVKRPA